ncbi:ankyrin repeat domain-containing protein [Candidatus Tisiphia endosymbiont of Nemotelus uliginosus]|uniref:ankyrin repeat domain-containing protein n=1 Tax=Candidatus Tisiphia endosymbiont of Nemotelus uliginosus TaxID=3077926 RepID=UPI0035C91E1D
MKEAGYRNVTSSQLVSKPKDLTFFEKLQQQSMIDSQELKILNSTKISDNSQFLHCVIENKLSTLLKKCIDAGIIDSIKKEELELIYKILIKDEDGISQSIKLKPDQSLSREASEMLLNLHNKDKKAFDLHSILPIMDKDADDKENNTMLHFAASAGLIDLVNTLMNSGLDPNIVNSRERTPLHSAARAGNNEVIRRLLEKNASINAQDEEGMAPLHLAALAGHIDTVKELVELGADKDITTQDGSTASALAESKGYNDIAWTLTLGGGDVGDVPTTLTLREPQEDVGTVQALDQPPASISARRQKGINIPGTSANQAYTPTIKVLAQSKAELGLHEAARAGNISLLTKSLAEGINVDHQNSIGNTALHAAHHSTPSITDKLITKDASLDIKNTKGRTALEAIIQKGHQKTVAKSLMQYIKDAPSSQAKLARCKKKIEELRSGQHSKNREVRQFVRNILPTFGKVQQRLEIDPDYIPPIPVQPKDKLTLYLAAKRGNISQLKDRLAEGSNVDDQNSQGNTALHVVHKRRLTITDELITKGASLDIKNTQGRTALEAIIQKGHQKTVAKSLIQYIKGAPSHEERLVRCEKTIKELQPGQHSQVNREVQQFVGDISPIFK